MFELLTIGAILAGLMVVLGLMAVIFKLVFWVVFLPFRIAGVVFKLAFGILLLPILAIAGVIGLIGVVTAAIAAVLLPLVPIVLAGVVVWAFAKWLGRPAVAPPHA